MECKICGCLSYCWTNDIEQCPPLTLRLSWRIFHFQHASSCDKYGPLLHIQSVPLDFYEGAAISAVTKPKRWRLAVFIFLSVQTLDINGCSLCRLQKWSQNIPDMNDGDVINDWVVISRPYTHPQPGLRCQPSYFNPFLWQTSAWQATTLRTFIWGVLFLVWPMSCLIWLTLRPAGGDKKTFWLHFTRLVQFIDCLTAYKTKSY